MEKKVDWVFNSVPVSWGVHAQHVAFCLAGSNAVTIGERFNDADSALATVSLFLSLFVSLLRCSDVTREWNLLGLFILPKGGGEALATGCIYLGWRGWEENEKDYEGIMINACTRTHVCAYALKRCRYTCTLTHLYTHKHTYRLVSHTHTYI